MILHLLFNLENSPSAIEHNILFCSTAQFPFCCYNLFSGRFCFAFNIRVLCPVAGSLSFSLARVRCRSSCRESIMWLEKVLCSTMIRDNSGDEKKTHENCITSSLVMLLESRSLCNQIILGLFVYLQFRWAFFVFEHTLQIRTFFMWFWFGVHKCAALVSRVANRRRSHIENTISLIYGISKSFDKQKMCVRAILLLLLYSLVCSHDKKNNIVLCTIHVSRLLSAYFPAISVDFSYLYILSIFCVWFRFGM